MVLESALTVTCSVPRASHFSLGLDLSICKVGVGRRLGPSSCDTVLGFEEMVPYSYLKPKAVELALSVSPDSAIYLDLGQVISPL